MYLYLGENVIVYEDDVIGIFDLDNTTVSKSTRDFLSNAEKNKTLVNITNELPKSFVLCDRDNSIVTYLAQLSTGTLAQRAARSVIG